MDSLIFFQESLYGEPVEISYRTHLEESVNSTRDQPSKRFLFRVFSPSRTVQTVLYLQLRSSVIYLPPSQNTYSNPPIRNRSSGNMGITSLTCRLGKARIGCGIAQSHEENKTILHLRHIGCRLRIELGTCSSQTIQSTKIDGAHCHSATGLCGNDC